MHIRILPIYK